MRRFLTATRWNLALLELVRRSSRNTVQRRSFGRGTDSKSVDCMRSGFFARALETQESVMEIFAEVSSALMGKTEIGVTLFIACTPTLGPSRGENRMQKTANQP